MRAIIVYSVSLMMFVTSNINAQENLDTLEYHISTDTLGYTPPEPIEQDEPSSILEENSEEAIYQEPVQEQEVAPKPQNSKSRKKSKEAKTEIQQVKTSQNAENQNNKSDLDFGGFLIACLGIWLVFKIIGWITRSHCPKCRKFFLMSVTDTKQVGQAFCGTKKNSAGKKERVYEYKYRIKRTCSVCGHVKTSYKTERETKSA